MSQPCRAWQADPHVHVTADKRAARQKRIDGLAELSDQERSHYYFLYAAAAADCVECTKYWLQNGADTTRGTKHVKYTAKEWAEWKSASNVLDILLSWEQAGTADIDEDMSPSSDTSNALFQDAVDFSFWRNAMAGDWKMTKEWCDVRAIVPMAIGLVNRTDSPERMFHWGVRQYLQFALLCNDSARKKHDLERIKTMVWQREQEQVGKTMQFVKAIHDDGDLKYTSLVNILNGDICFKPSDDTDDASGIVGFGYSCISWKPIPTGT